MSMPIPVCCMIAAAKGDEDAWHLYIKAMTYNLACGHYSTFPCRCETPCELPTQEQQDAFQLRVDEYFREHPVKRDDIISGYQGPVGISGYSGVSGASNMTEEKKKAWEQINKNIEASRKKNG